MIHFKDYERFHQTKNNKLCHYIAVPLVLFSLLGLLSYVVLWTPSLENGAESLFRIDLGLLLFIFGAFYAFRIDKKLAVPYLLYSYLNYLVARHLSLSVLVGIQAAAWTVQFIGHYAYEKKSPAFFTNIAQLMIGPMWTFAKAIGYYSP